MKKMKLNSKSSSISCPFSLRWHLRTRRYGFIGLWILIVECLSLLLNLLLIMMSYIFLKANIDMLCHFFSLPYSIGWYSKYTYNPSWNGFKMILALWEYINFCWCMLKRSSISLIYVNLSITKSIIFLVRFIYVKIAFIYESSNKKGIILTVGLQTHCTLPSRVITWHSCPFLVQRLG